MTAVTVQMATRMRRLWDMGLSYAAIAAVVSLDFGVDITDHQVRGALRFHTRATRESGGARKGAAGMSKLSGRRFGTPDMSGSRS